MPIGPLLELKIDINGTAESRLVAFDYVNLLATGDSLTGVPTVEQASETTGAPSLTLGAPSISGTQARVRVSGTNLVAGEYYDLSCTTSTANGDTLVASCGVVIEPSK